MPFRDEPRLLAGPNGGDPRRRPGGRDRFAPARDAVIEYEPVYRPRYDPGYDEPAPQHKTLGEVVSQLWERRLLIVTAATVCAVLALTFAALLPKRYNAQGMMSVEASSVFLGQLGVQMPPAAPDVLVVRSVAQIMTSRGLLEAVSRSLQLEKDPEFNPYIREDNALGGVRRGISNVVGGMTDGIRSALGQRLPAPAPGGASGDPVWDAVVDNVQRNLSVGTDGRSYVIYVNFDAEDPSVAAKLVNSLMNGFVSSQQTRNRTEQTDANQWARQRSEELRTDVEAADRKVQAFRTKNALVETKGGTVSNQQLSEINTQLTLARASRAEAEARFNRAREESRRTGSPDATYEVLGSDLVQRLREQETATQQKLAEISTRLGNKHPQRVAVERQLTDVRKDIKAETDRIMRALATQVDVARSRENTLQSQLSRNESTATRSAAAEVELRQLEKEADTKRMVYQTFLATAQQTADPMRFGMPATKVVSEAVASSTAASPKPGVYGLTGGFAGFLLASAFALARTDQRRSLRSPVALARSLGVSVLGVLPSASGRAGRVMREIGKHPFSAAAESLRGVRVALMAQTEGARGTVVLVTSAQPHEGKTSFVGALALNSAADGLKVLAVESDLRRPGLRQALGYPDSNGLAATLRGQAPFAEAVHHQDGGPDGLFAGGRVRDPASLVYSGQWRQLLEQARQNYELVILDSPPVLHVADALVLARMVDEVVLVVDPRVSDEDEVRETLRRFEETSCPVSGIVLATNAARVSSRLSYYGYGPN